MGEYKLSEVNDCLRMEIKGDENTSYDEYVAILNECKEAVSSYYNKELQTFVNVSHISELEFFLSHGFYVWGTMLMLEKDLEEEIDQTSSDISVQFETYDYKSKGLCEYLAANKAGFDGVQDPEEQIVNQLSQPKGQIFVAREDGKIVSSVTVWEIGEGIAATENVFTIPEYREKHIASFVLTKVLNELKNEGYKKVRLSVYGDDTPAYNMYFGMGYHLVDSNFELRF